MPRSLADMNPDVLACVALAVYDAQRTQNGAGLLKTFSTTSKRIRSASLPALYRVVSITRKSVRESTEIMHGLRGAGPVTRYIR